MRNTAPKDAAELDALETREWLESLDYVLQSGGPAKVGRLLRELTDPRRGRTASSCRSPPTLPTSTPSPPTNRRRIPGSREIERRIKSLVRWNALAMVVRANKARRGHRRPHLHLRVGRHAYEVGFNHFFRGKGDGHDGDIIYFQGHAAPGIYARAFLEGRLDETAARELPPRAEGRAAACRRIRTRG